MTIQDVVQAVDKMDIFQKSKIYMDYMITHTALKYRFEWWLQEHMKKYNPDYLWNGIYIEPYESFMDTKKCIKVHDFGENWQKRGCAQRYDTTYTGIYDWYFRFNNRITI